MKHFKIKVKFILIILCLIFIAGLAPGAVSHAAAAPSKQLNVLYLAPLTKQPPICVGGTKNYGVTIMDAKDVPVSGATIIVDGKKTDSSSAKNGNASAPYTPQKVGKFTFNVSASKNGFTNAVPQPIQGEAVQCDWRIRMNYEEKVYTQGKLFVADCVFKFPDQSFKRDDYDNLVLTMDSKNINATYTCTSGAVSYPLGSRLSPDIQGMMEINFSGKYIPGSGLQITLSSTTGGYLPRTIQIEVINSVQKKVVRTVTWGMRPNADIVNQAKITNWKANPNGDTKDFHQSSSLFLAEKGLTCKGNGTVTVEADKPSK